MGAMGTSTMGTSTLGAGEEAAAPRPQAGPVRFLVTGMQRSGTTLVYQILAGHPDVAANPREAAPALFHGFNAASFNTPRDLFAGRKDADPIGPGETLRRLFDLAVEEGTRIGDHAAAGLKVATGSPAEAVAMVEAILAHAPDLRIIHVRREDPVAVAASFVDFLQNPERRQIFEGSARPSPRLSIRRDVLVRHVHDWHFINAAFDRLAALPHYRRIDYGRDIASGALLGGAALFDAIGVPKMQPDWVSLRKSLPAKEETVVNLAECERVAAAVQAGLAEGMALPELFRRHGPSLASLVMRLAGEALRHPATSLRRSYWIPLKWKVAGQ